MNVSAQTTNQAYFTYIDTYKGLALEQMHKYKVPASITLAQGLFESAAGRSTLATQANNHFGIKVGTGWTGPYILRDDDAKNEKFRKYNSVKESYEDHSKFLQQPRYKSLFQLSQTDYKGWARGLKAAGYATSPTYAESLINIIERYNLSQFDGKSYTLEQTAKHQGLNDVFFQTHTVYKNNKNYYIIVEVDDNMATISQKCGVSLRKLYKYNELPCDYVPTQGDIVYLQKKRKEASKEFKHYPIHIVEADQSLHDICQMYGIRLKNLYKLNQFTSDYTPKPGDILRIR